MAAGHVGEVALLEGRVAAVLAGQARQQLVHLRDGPGVQPALFDQGRGHEGGALGEEVQDVQGGQFDQAVVEELGVPGEPGVRGGGPEPAGEGLGSEADGLHVGEGEVAQGVEGHRERRRHAGLLAGRERPLARGPQGLADQVVGQPAQVRRVEVAFLAPGDVGGDALRAVDQARARALGA